MCPFLGRLWTLRPPPIPTCHWNTYRASIANLSKLSEHLPDIYRDLSSICRTSIEHISNIYRQSIEQRSSKNRKSKSKAKPTDQIRIRITPKLWNTIGNQLQPQNLKIKITSKSNSKGKIAVPCSRGNQKSASSGHPK